MKKTRKLLGKKGAAKKKTGQSMEDGRDMDIPVAALVGARKGLVYCLVGLIAHKRYSSKVPHPSSFRTQSMPDTVTLIFAWYLNSCDWSGMAADVSSAEPCCARRA